MFCPRCGEERVSEATSFCSRCGFLLTVAAELVPTGGELPKDLSKAISAQRSPRSRGFEARGFPACVRVRNISVSRDAAGRAVRPVVAAGRANGLFSCRSGPAQNGLRRVVRIEIPGGFAAPSGLDSDARFRGRQYPPTE